MGTEILCYIRYVNIHHHFHVKLNNPLMGTEISRGRGCLHSQYIVQLN
ncbi:hypothetical protein HMPREF0870_01955 [Veillonella atypica KON]|uniref:Uncharacterized protein n=1 Tax=Veillonella atypica KON TaxID=1128111 RepID=A0ABN0II01_9FIRM|nr:hypothetical protein HMPREF0870_01955 [Veillonella atypica KON]